MALLSLPMAAFFPALLDEALACTGGGSCGSGRRAFASWRTAVEASDDGWLLTAKLPGVAATEVTVEVVAQDSQGAELNIHALPHFQDTLSLPAEADTAGVTASLVNGELRVAVPKKAPETVAVPFSSSAAAADEEAAAAVTTVEVAVPGLCADDLLVTVHRPAVANARAVLAVDRSNGGRAIRRLHVPAGVDASAIAASCIHGLLRLRIPAAEPPVAVAVAVNEVVDGSEAPSSQEEQEDGCEALLRVPLPGVAASALAISVEGRVLKVEAKADAAGTSSGCSASKRCRQSVRAELPAAVAANPAAIRAQLHRGILLVSGPKPPAPIVTVLPLATDVPASLPAIISTA